MMNLPKRGAFGVDDDDIQVGVGASKLAMMLEMEVKSAETDFLPSSSSAHVC
jgi:hypothetical protein